MSLPLLHAGRTNPGLSAALDLRFALDKSLTAYRGPTPSFSRASTGSYFDGSGVLRYANVNLLLQSEAFSTSPWSNLGLPTITTNTDISPDGKQTADTINDSSTGSFWGVSQTISVTSGATYTFSIYIKKTFVSPTNYPLIQIQVGASSYSALIFNTFNGSISVATGGSYVAPASYQSVEISGYWRVSITAVINTSSPQMQFYPAGSSDGSTISSAATGSAVVWGAQLEASSTVGTYCPTTSSANSAPRFNHTYNGTSWVSRGLLVEEQRTNLLLHSNPYAAALDRWGTSNGTLTANAVTSPDGTQNASSVVGNNGANPYQIYYYLNQSSGVYTQSFYLKQNGPPIIGAVDFTGNLPVAWFNLSNGTAQGGSSGGVNYSASISNVGNGWYRCSVTSLSSVQMSWLHLRPYTAMGGSTNVVGDGVSGFYVYGVQAEAGSFATSLISTNGSATTRSADVCQITGTDFSGFWNGTEGSTAAEYDLIGVAGTGTFGMVFQVDDNTLNNRLVQIGYEAGTTPNNAAGIFVANGGVAQANMYQSSIGTNLTGKASFAYKANDFALSVNGASVSTDTSGSIPAVTQMNIGRRISDGYLNGHISRLRYYRKRLPNETLQLLSEPDPTLNLQFALNKSLTPVAGPAPSFSRASTGTFFNASGVLTSASINTPRFDHVYSGGQWVSRGLLVEEQRTNLAIWSEDFTNAAWSKPNVNVSGNAVIAPDGNLTADLVYPVPGSTWAYAGIERNNGGGVAGNPMTISFFFKAAGKSWVSVHHGDGSDAAWFNISTGTIGTIVSGTPSISNVGNGWYKCSITRNISSNGSGWTVFRVCDADGSISVTGSGTNGVYAWGAQTENGAFPTSYIGTTTSSVTRSADVCQITGTSFNWMWNQGEGSFAVEAGTFSDSSYLGRYLEFTRTSSVGSPSIGVGTINSAGSAGGDNVYNYVWDSSTQAALYASPARPLAKSSFAWKVNDFAASINGATALTDTSGTVPTGIDVLTIGSRYGSLNIINGHIAKLIYYPARLTNTKLQQLST